MPTPTYKNRIGQASSTTGTGTLTLGAAETGYQALGSGDNGLYFDVVIEDGTAWEIARECLYTHSGTTLTRGTLEASSTGSAISLSGGQKVYVTQPANRINLITGLAGAWGVLEAENSITGASTALINRLNVCSGTSANYTVTLPAVSGNAGKYIGFHMDEALTKLVTLDGNASETIDGELTRIMWAQETALLYCDGAKWTKIAGKTIPLSVGLQRTSVTGNQSFSQLTWTACQTPELAFGVDMMRDTTNHRIKIVRPGIYVVIAAIYVTGYGITFAYGNAGKNQAGNTQVLANIFSSSGSAIGSVSTVYSCAVDDYLVGSAYMTGSSLIFDSAATTSIVAVEQPKW